MTQVPTDYEDASSTPIKVHEEADVVPPTPPCTQNAPMSPSMISPPCSQVMPPSSPLQDPPSHTVCMPPSSSLSAEVVPPKEDDDVEMKQAEEPSPTKEARKDDNDDDVEMKDAEVTKKRSRSRSPAPELSPRKCKRKAGDADVAAAREVPAESDVACPTQ